MPVNLQQTASPQMAQTHMNSSLQLETGLRQNSPTTLPNIQFQPTNIRPQRAPFQPLNTRFAHSPNQSQPLRPQAQTASPQMTQPHVLQSLQQNSPATLPNIQFQATNILPQGSPFQPLNTSLAQSPNQPQTQAQATSAFSPANIIAQSLFSPPGQVTFINPMLAAGSGQKTTAADAVGCN